MNNDEAAIRERARRYAFALRETRGRFTLIACDKETGEVEPGHYVGVFEGTLAEVARYLSTRPYE